MYFFGFVEFLKVSPKFKKLKINEELTLESWEDSKKEVQFYRKRTSFKRKADFPILVYRKTGLPTYNMGLYFAPNRFDSFTTAVSLKTAQRCKVNVWFGLDDSKSAPLVSPHDEKNKPESMWLPDYKNFESDSFYFFDNYSNIQKKLINTSKFKTSYANIVPNLSDWYGYSRLKNALRYYQDFIDTFSFVKIFSDAFIILESLFSDDTDTEAINYKIASRISWFLYPNDEVSRLETFKQLSDWYAIRSAILHGRDYENRVQKRIGKTTHSLTYLSENSPKVKLLVSQVLNKIVTDNEFINIFNDENNISQFFKKLTLNIKIK